MESLGLIAPTAAQSRQSFTTELAPISDSGFVQENAPAQHPFKHDLYWQLDQLLPPPPRARRV